MNKQGLIEEVAFRTSLPKAQAEKMVKTVLQTVADALAQGEKVQLSGFGTFEVRTRKQAEMYIPGTEQKKLIPELKVPAFTASAALKEAVNPKNKP